MKFLIILALTFTGFLAHAEVSTHIDASKISELHDYLTNFQYDLTNGFNKIVKLPIPQQEKELRDLVNQVLEKDYANANAFYSRNLLFRIRLLHDVILKGEDTDVRAAVSRQILKDGITWALELYVADVNGLKNTSLTQTLPNLEFSKMGLDWLEYVLYIFYQIPNNQARLQISLDALGVAFNDIDGDTAFKRILAPVMQTIMQDHQRFSAQVSSNKLDFLKISREVRASLEAVVRRSEDLLKDVTSRDPARFIFNQIRFANVREIDMHIYTPQKRKGKDCYEYICVGDIITVIGQHALVEERIRGVFKTMWMIGLPGEYGPYFSFKYIGRAGSGASRFSSLQLAKGCFHHVCLGEDIYYQWSDYISRSRATGYSPAHNVYSMDKPHDYMTHVSPSSIFVTKGCYKGICVGMRSGHSVVIGINPISEKYLIDSYGINHFRSDDLMVIRNGKLEILPYKETAEILF